MEYYVRILNNVGNNNDNSVTIRQYILMASLFYGHDLI